MAESAVASAWLSRWAFWRSKDAQGDWGGSDVLPVRVHGVQFSATSSYPVQVKAFDQPLLFVTLGLMIWGLVMVYSASIAMPDNPKFSHYAQTHFLVRHLFALGLSLVVGAGAFLVPLQTWEKHAKQIFVASIVLLVLVVVPFLGHEVNGAKRWISLGIMNFQPSELAKFGVLLYAADYMVRKMEVKEKFFTSVIPMAIAVAVVGWLLLLEPDMGAFMVIAVIAMGILFLGGVNARMFFLIALVVVAVFASIIYFSDWRRERIFAYLDPWSLKYSMGKGYQLSHSLIAIGRGEIFGVGLGGSVEKLHWLPEAHTDFLLAVIGEEFGFVGVVGVIGLFMWLTRRIMYIGRQAIAMDQVFAGLFAQGVGIWVGFQSFINVGVNLGALPTKGLTLPLMSFGGSAILLNVIAIAVVMRVDYENRIKMHGGRL